MPDPSFPSPSASTAELLAGYVLGDLTPDEAAVVEEYLAAHPEEQAEVASLMLSLDLLPLTLPTNNPPPLLRQQIIQTATAEAVAITPPVTRSIVPRFPRWKSLVAGLGLVLIAGLGWNSYRLSHELAAVKQDLKTAQIAQNPQRYQQYQSVVSLLPQPNNRYFSLKNMQGKSGMGSLVMVPNKSVAVLVLQKVAPLPPGQVYRVWAIVGDEEMDCAHFIPDGDGKVLMQIPLKSWEKADKITITIERKEATEPEGEIAIEGEV
ncbi:anti-sigma factor [Chamaesiphon sp. VAR_48_metabat_403]|uniref:anti-sigma factor n=1 Tax=Chamaesiphon sp. VAR_48_metabat_403 TaxID=2964700 RepID=UPI00286E5280|nr:anti-sigma factor [Chamaesiphon sp. VAR_48_metabat_403]